MTRDRALLALGHALKSAAADRNWPEVMRVDAQLAAMLVSLRGRPLTPAMEQVLNEVQHLHTQVMRYCQTSSDILAEKMALSRRNREGAAAYAIFADDGEPR